MKKYLNFTGLLFIILLSLFQVSCNYSGVVISDIKDVKLEKINADNISLNITVPIVNPNSFKINITKYNLLIKINNQEFQLVEVKRNIRIPKKFNGTISFPIKLKSNKVFSLKTLTNLYRLFSSKKAEIEVVGTIKIRVLLIPKKIKINEKRTVNF